MGKECWAFSSDFGTLRQDLEKQDKEIFYKRVRKASKMYGMDNFDDPIAELKDDG